LTVGWGDVRGVAHNPTMSMLVADLKARE